MKLYLSLLAQRVTTLVMRESAETLGEVGVPYELIISSGH